MDRRAQIDPRRRFSAAAVIALVLAIGPAAAPARANSSNTRLHRARPKPLVLPTISGTAAEGQTLSATHGRWSHKPIRYSYRWLDCNVHGRACKPDPGATRSTYTLTAADVGHTVRVKVVASNRSGTSVARSRPTRGALPLAPAILAGPSIDGDLTAGRILLAVDYWSTKPSQLSYQWRSCAPSGSCTVVSTARTYTLASSDVGNTITLSETATNKGGTTGPVSSMATAPVAPAGPSGDRRPPVESLAPLIYGQLAAGDVLIAHQGAWEGTPALTWGFQWQLCATTCSDIAGATSTTYTIPSTDAGDSFRVVVSATNSWGSAEADSNDLGPVPTS